MATTFDGKANFVYSTVVVAPSPTTSGTSLSIGSSDASNFPDPSSKPYNIIIWPDGTRPTSSNAEIVRVTAKSGAVLTITRGQEGTTARNVLVGDQVMLAPTAKSFTDIESALNTVETWKESITSSTDELNILDGVTATTAELNTLDGITASTDELNTLDGITASTAELNQLDGVEVGGTSSGDIVTLGGSQTLTNKTLTSPSMTNPVLDNNSPLQGKDSGGTARDLIKVGSNGVAYFGDNDLEQNMLRVQCKFSAYLSSNQSIPNSTWTTIHINTDEFDDSGIFDTSNYQFKAPVAGVYLFIGHISMDSVPDAKKVAGRFLKNGTTSIWEDQFASSVTGDIEFTLTRLVQLSADDTIELQTWQNSGSSLDLQATSGGTQYSTMLQGILLSTW